MIIQKQLSTVNTNAISIADAKLKTERNVLEHMRIEHILKSCPLKMILALFAVILLLTDSALSQDAVETIQNAYFQFKYNDVLTLSREALDRDPALSVEQQVEILTYSAFANIALGNGADARDDFNRAFDLDQSYSLDPDDVSPKILSVFEEVKRIRIAETNRARADSILTIKRLKSEGALRSLALPGWGQLHKGETLKGYILAGTHALNLTTLLYTHLRTDQTRDDYLAERDPFSIESKYDTYNRYYKLRNTFLLTTAAVWLYAHIDAAFSDPDFDGGDQLPVPNSEESGLQPVLQQDGIYIRYHRQF